MATATLAQMQALLSAWIRRFPNVTQADVNTHLRQYQSDPSGYDLASAADTFDPQNTTGLAPVPGGTPPGGSPPAAQGPLTDLQNVEATYDPYTAFLQQIGIGGRTYLNPAEQYKQSLVQPIDVLKSLQEKMGMALMGAPAAQSFTDYASPFLNAPGNIYSKARELWGTLMGQSPTRRGEGGFAYEPTYGFDDKGERVRTTGNIQELQALLKLAGGSPFGMRGSTWLSKRLPEEQQKWVSTQAAGQGTGESFLDYIRSRYNI